MIEGGWVCLSCWHSNKPRDRTCYRCHTPRPELASTGAGPISQRTGAGPWTETRLDTELPFLTFLTVLPMRLYGTFAVGLGVVIFVLGLVGGGGSGLGWAGIPDETLLILFILSGISTSLSGFALIFLAKRVGRHARWAYVVTLLWFLPGPLLGLVAGVKPFTSDVASVAWLIAAWVSVGTGICAGALLVTSFVPRSAE